MTNLPLRLDDLPPDVKSIIETRLKNAIKNSLNSYPYLKFALKKWWKFLTILGGIILIVGVIFSIFSTFKNDDTLRIAFIVVAIVGLCITLITTTLTSRAVGILRSKISKQEILEIYNDAINQSIKFITVKNYYPGFKSGPGFSNFFQGSNAAITIQGIINDNYYYEVGNTYDIIREQRQTLYRWYRYFVINIDSVDNFKTIITPESFLTRIFSGHDKSELESLEFEKIFKLDYSDPIKLRELLTPNVMLKMVDVAKLSKKFRGGVPTIFVNNNMLGLKWSLGDTATSNFSSEVLTADLITKTTNESKIATRFFEKLLRDVNMIYICFLWGQSLDRFKIKGVWLPETSFSVNPDRKP